MIGADLRRGGLSQGLHGRLPPQTHENGFANSGRNKRRFVEESRGNLDKDIYMLEGQKSEGLQPTYEAEQAV